MADILSMFYVSHATVLNDRSSVASVLQTSRPNNLRLGITGCLLYTGQFFAQLLEGQEADVEALFTKISADPRHKWSRVLQREALEMRQYDRLSMGFIYATGLEDDLYALLASSTAPQVLEKVKLRMWTDSVMGGLS